MDRDSKNPSDKGSLRLRESQRELHTPVDSECHEPEAGVG